MTKTQKLAERITSLKEAIQNHKVELDLAEAELIREVSGDFTLEMLQREKYHGSISKEVGGVKLQWDVKQTVTWDQAKLRALWEALPKEVGDRLIELKFSVSEAVFKAQCDPQIIDALVDARTTKLSAPTIKIKE